MNALFAIATATLKATMRNRLSIMVLLFTSAMLALISLMTASSLNEEVRLMKDLGLFLGSLIASLATLALCAHSLHRDLERKSLFTLATKPISRGIIIWGKYLGISLSAFILVLLMASAWALLALRLGAPLEWMMCGAWWLVWIEALVIGGIAMFFGSFSSPLVSSSLAFGVMLVGRFNQELIHFQERAWRRGDDTLAFDLSVWVTQIAPDLSAFNVTEEVVYGTHLPLEYTVKITLMGLGYSAVCVMLACWIFSRRDLT